MSTKISRYHPKQVFLVAVDSNAGANSEGNGRQRRAESRTPDSDSLSRRFLSELRASLAQTMWHGPDAAPTDRVDGGRDRDDGTVATNVFSETAVDTVTASVTGMVV